MVPEVRREAAADQVEEGRLAGTVRADHRVALALLDGEVHAVDDGGLAEALADVAQFEGGGHLRLPVLR
jgi:hypothetical protein